MTSFYAVSALSFSNGLKRKQLSKGSEHTVVAPDWISKTIKPRQYIQASVISVAMKL